MRKHRVFIPCFMFTFLIFAVSHSAQKRGIQVTPKPGKAIYLYKDYHALVVGIGDYDYWPDLKGAENDAREIAKTLENAGMKVHLVLNPMELKRALNEMTYEIGQEENRAILIYFSGHGETESLATGEKMGYIVPKDCPLPTKDPIGFSEKAISMNDIESYALRIKSRHVLMVFDSCFSGAVFKPFKGVPSDISEKSARPVRQFIAAGSEDEEVPDDSIFKTCFIQGIGGEADYNKDGYVTGTELGMYLDVSVVNYTRGAQHPQFGKIRHPNLDKGDFIFNLAAISITEANGTSRRQNSLLSVESNVLGAGIFVDGREVGKTSLLYSEIMPGEHEVKVEMEGYETYSETIDLEKGELISLYIDLNRVGPRKARISVITEPENAKVRILNIRPKFFQNMVLDPGKYQLEISSPGYRSKKMWIQLNAGEEKNVRIHLSALATDNSDHERIRDQNGTKDALKKTLANVIKGFLSCLYGANPNEISKFVCKEISPQLETALEAFRNKLILASFDPLHGVSFGMAEKAVSNIMFNFKSFEIELLESSAHDAKARYSTKLEVRMLHPESGVYIPSDVKEKDAELQFIRETGKWKVCPPSDKLNQNFDLEK